MVSDSLAQICCPSESSIIIFQWILDFTSFMVYDIFDLYPLEKSAAILHFIIRTALKMFLLIFITIYAIGFLRVGLNPEIAKRWIKGRSLLFSYLMAAVFGAVTPFCSCSAVSIFIGFTAGGLPLGVTMAFLVTSPMINEFSLLLLFSEFGALFTFVYLFFGIAAGVLAGWFFEKVENQRLIKNLDRERLHIKTWSAKNEALTMAVRNRAALLEVKNIFSRIWIFIIISIVIASFLHVYLSVDKMREFLDITGHFSVVAAVFLGIPIYSNSTAIIPAAKVLAEKGLPLGTVVVFMMSSAAVSLPEFVLLKQILTGRAVTYLLLFFVVIFIFLGVVLNFLF